MAVPISNVTRRQVYAPSGAGGAGPYAFTFEILANTDIAVYKDDVLLTLTTHYTVTINANGTGSVTITAAGLALAPASPTQYAIVGNRTISRTTDFTTGGDFFANTLNDELDQQTIFAQQNAEGLQRALAAPQTDPTSINMTLPRAALRANKALGFDANGNPVISDTLGTNRGDWSAGVLYYARDIVKDTTNNNIWQCLVQHTSSGSQPINTNADSAKWSLLVDAASATTSAANAASSASAASTSASNASTSASNASTSASNASTSASNAASSASAASTSASNAAASYDSFDDRYLGPKSSAPSVDNDGNSLLTGALYWDTVINQMRVWSGTAWVNVNASASNTRTAITATAGQTVLTVATYTPGTNTMVLYVNGVKLNASEYTETNATTVTLTTGLALNDEVEVFSYRVNEIGTLGASSVTIADTGNYYTGGNVETALQEAAAFTQGGTGAQTRAVTSKLREVISVKDFGAVGNGSDDDTTAIQNAINYAKTRQNAEVYFPPHEQSQFYKTTAPIVIDRAVSIRGDSPSTTVLSIGLTSSQYVIDYNCLATDVVEQAFIKGLTLRTNNGVASALRLKNASYITVKDVRVYNVLHGVFMEGTRCFSNTFEELNAYSVSGSTVRFAANFSGGGHFTFLGCTFTGDTGFILPTTALADSITLTGCNFEQCATNSLYIGGSCRGVSLLGCRTEGCNGDDIQIAPGSGESVEGITITGTSFTTDAGASRPIILGGPGGTVRGFSITGNQVEYAGAGTSFVFLNGEGESGLIAGNYFAQNNTTPINVQRTGVIVFGNENSAGKCAEYWGSADWGVAQGTWVPVDASGAGLTLTGGGRYTKIGRQVFWQALVVYPTNSNGTNASIGGLPYAVGGLGGNTEGRSGASADLTNYGANIGILQGIPANTNLSIYNQITAASLTNANLSGKYIYCSGMYTLTT